MRVLMLIMSHETEDSNFKNYKRIWDEQISNLDKNKYNIEFKFLYSDNNISEEYEIEGNNLLTKCIENYWFALLQKVLCGFDYFIKKDFDLVFKTNLSTIVNFEKLYDYFLNIPIDREFVYDGITSKYKDYFFCSGAGMLLNRNSVELVLKHKHEINESWTDDIFVGYILNKIHNISPNQGNLNRYDIFQENSHFTKEEILNSTHIRIKVRKNDLDTIYSNMVYNYLLNK